MTHSKLSYFHETRLIEKKKKEKKHLTITNFVEKHKHVEL